MRRANECSEMTKNCSIKCPESLDHYRESDLTPEMALRLSKAFGRTPESWMQMQVNYELWRAKQHVNLDRVHVIYVHAS